MSVSWVTGCGWLLGGGLVLSLVSNMANIGTGLSKTASETVAKTAAQAASTQRNTDQNSYDAALGQAMTTGRVITKLKQLSVSQADGSSMASSMKVGDRGTKGGNQGQAVSSGRISSKSKQLSVSQADGISMTSAMKVGDRVTKGGNQGQAIAPGTWVSDDANQVGIVNTLGEIENPFDSSTKVLPQLTAVMIDAGNAGRQFRDNDFYLTPPDGLGSAQGTPVTLKTQK